MTRFIEPEAIDEEEECCHDCLDDDNFCMCCGMRVQKLAVENDAKYSIDCFRTNVRCQVKQNTRTLVADLSHTGIPTDILHDIDKQYKLVVGDRVFRGQPRLAIAFILIKNHYLYELNETIDPDVLAEKIGVQRNKISKGREIYEQFLKVNKQYKRRPRYVTPLDFLPILLKKTNLTSEYMRNLTGIYNIICDCPQLMTSKPQSVAAGLLYYFIHKKNMDICKKDFCDVVNVSDITVTKIYKEIDTILS